MPYLAFQTEAEAAQEFEKHKAPKRIIKSPHPDNKNGDFFVEWGKEADGIVRTFEVVVRSKH